MIQNDLKLCLVTHMQMQSLATYQAFLLHALAGGVTSVQLREKNKTIEQLIPIALAFKAILNPFKIPLIINDHIELAKEVDAAGVHLGQSDISPEYARKQLGSQKIIGLSIETLEQLERANQLSCLNYIAASAIFSSKTKKDCRTIWGLDGLEELVRRSHHPVIAIGGIDQHNVRSVIDNGACGVAVISALHDQNNPKEMAKHLIETINLSLLRNKYA